MKVTLIAHTEFDRIPESVSNTKFGILRDDAKYAWHEEDLPHDADVLAEFAGRSCYQSWSMPNPETATTEGYLANIIKQGHFSVLEHASATFYVEGVSRNLTHELIRHRHLSYSELSQRFVDMSDAKFVVPPAVRRSYAEDDENAPVDGMQPLHTDESYEYSIVVDELAKAGYSRKQAREAARFYLPSGMETKIVVTGNMRAWRDMLHKRYSVHADAEIQEFAAEVLSQLREIAPASFQDFPETPFE